MSDDSNIRSIRVPFWLVLIILGVALEFVGRYFGQPHNPTGSLHEWAPLLTTTLAATIILAGVFALLRSRSGDAGGGDTRGDAGERNSGDDVGSDGARISTSSRDGGETGNARGSVGPASDGSAVDVPDDAQATTSAAQRQAACLILLGSLMLVASFACKSLVALIMG